jgi:hypothetical protein
MNELRWNRLILAGLAAGAVLLAGETFLNSFLLGLDWQQVFLELRVAPMSTFAAVMIVLITVLLGLVQAWLIARLQQNPAVTVTRSVMESACFIWLTVFAYTGTWLALLAVFPVRIMALGIMWGLGECVLSGLTAAWIYGRR